ncbi:hypothetical protein CFK37_18930 [Virgibacillus phasianinus]|uniref:Uncharacterized protein n=1 Tax=Virgibacillus phasianinus TaxID=2017483 RepID=A0A220U7J5_9BACI|nr:CBO0543 family protein [Virgibacillus phasianinus]ASK64080.1 hypothetical protein CFK37_18930 [Virgibacillus phasianinus]
MEPQLTFMIVACLVLITIAYFIPKKMKWYEIYTTAVFMTLFGLIVDTVLAVKYKFYVLDQEGVQIPALIGQILLYSSSTIIILNAFPYHKSKKSKLIYVICFSILSIIFEFIAVQFGFIKYNEWRIWYSALCYPFIISFVILHFRFFKWLVKRSIWK